MESGERTVVEGNNRTDGGSRFVDLGLAVQLGITGVRQPSEVYFNNQSELVIYVT